MFCRRRRTRWSRDIDIERNIGDGGGLYADETLVVVEQTDQVVGLDASDGSRTWVSPVPDGYQAVRYLGEETYLLVAEETGQPAKYDLAAEEVTVTGPDASDQNSGRLLAATDDRLFVFHGVGWEGGRVVAYDRADLTEQWRTEKHDWSPAASGAEHAPGPAGLYVDGWLLVRASVRYHNEAKALDAETGAVTWSTNLDGGGGTANGSLVAADDAYVYTTREKRLLARELASGEIAWEYNSIAPIDDVVVGEDTAYALASDGTLTALDAGTGDTRTTYETKLADGRQLTIAGNRLYTDAIARYGPVEN